MLKLHQSKTSEKEYLLNQQKKLPKIDESVLEHEKLIRIEKETLDYAEELRKQGYVKTSTIFNVLFYLYLYIDRQKALLRNVLRINTKS